MEVTRVRAVERAAAIFGMIGALKLQRDRWSCDFRNCVHSRKAGISPTLIPGLVAFSPPITEYRVFGDDNLATINASS